MNKSILDSDTRRRLREDLLGPLHMHFLTAAQAYDDYLASGKAFLFASALRRTNASVRRLLLWQGHLLRDEYQQDALALLRHYDVWLTQWDELATRAKPAIDQQFVFQSKISFPKEAQRRLIDLYNNLRAESLESARA